MIAKAIGIVYGKISYRLMKKLPEGSMDMAVKTLEDFGFSDEFARTRNYAIKRLQTKDYKTPIGRLGLHILKSINSPKIGNATDTIYETAAKEVRRLNKTA